MQSTHHVVAGCLLDAQKRLLVIRQPNERRLALDDERTPLTPLLRDAVLPALRKRFHA